MLIPVRESQWGIENFRGISSAGRRRVDQGIDLIFAHAALFAAQKEQTNHDKKRKITIRYEGWKCAKKDSLSWDSKSFLMVAEAGLEPTTSGLWARRASNCSTPRYRALSRVPEYYSTRVRVCQGWNYRPISTESVHFIVPVFCYIHGTNRLKIILDKYTIGY